MIPPGPPQGGGRNGYAVPSAAPDASEQAVSGIVPPPKYLLVKYARGMKPSPIAALPAPQKQMS